MYMYINKLIVCYLLLTLDRGGRRGSSKKSPGENSSFKKGKCSKRAQTISKD